MALPGCDPGPLGDTDTPAEDSELPTLKIMVVDCKQGAVRAVRWGLVKIQISNIKFLLAILLFHFSRYSVDGNYCMTAGQDKSVKLWNPNKGRPLKTYSGHGYEVLDVRGSCDNSQIVSCSMDKTIMLWDVSSGNWTRKWRGHQVRVIMMIVMMTVMTSSGGGELRLLQRGQQRGDQRECGHHRQDLGHQDPDSGEESANQRPGDRDISQSEA